MGVGSGWLAGGVTLVVGGVNLAKSDREVVMQKWEYKKISRVMDFTGINSFTLGPFSGPSYVWQDLPNDDSNRFMDETNRLKQLGEEGWELVRVAYEVVGRKHTYTYYLKRPI